MIYKAIYSPDGEMFEVPEERASVLLLNHGWSRTPPERKPIEPPAPPKAPVSDFFKPARKPVELPAPVDEPWPDAFKPAARPRTVPSVRKKKDNEEEE